MADKKISELVSLAGKDVAATDFFPVVDVSVAETKSLTRDELRNAVNAIHFTATKALATTAAASLPDDTIIEVAADESLSGARTRYTVAAGALVFAYGVVTKADLADASDPAKGAALVGYDGGDVQDVLDDAKPMASYAALRAYTGRATGVRVTSLGVAGLFQRDASDTTSADNGGTIIVDASGRRWKRVFTGAINLKWFGAVGDGVTDDTGAIVAAHAATPAGGGEILVPKGSYLHNAPLSFTKRIRLVGEGSNYISGASASEFLKGSGVTDAGLTLLGSGTSVSRIGFRGVSGNAGDGVHVRNGRITLDEVLVSGMGRDGVRIGNDTGDSNCNVWHLKNLRSKNNGRHGLHISDDARPTLPDANGGLLSLADLQYNGACGLYLGNNLVNTFIGICAQNNGTYGVFSSSASVGNFFYGGDYEVNGRPDGVGSTDYYDFFIESGSSGNTLLGGSSYNYPQSFKCDEPSNLILGFSDGVYTGQDKYAGLQLFNRNSPVKTVLDWYEEGVFTPVMEGITSSGVGTYSAQSGVFTRIGNLVRFNLNIAWSAHTGTGNMRIAGLPFTAATPDFQPAEVVPSALTTPAGAVVKAMVVGGAKAINLYSILTGGTTTFAPLAVDTSASLWISGTYCVA